MKVIKKPHKLNMEQLAKSDLKFCERLNSKDMASPRTVNALCTYRWDKGQLREVCT